jgi:hypothetical protein
MKTPTTLLALLFLTASPLGAQTVVISDTEFAVSDWDFVVARVDGNGGTGVALQQTSGGNPGNHRYVEHTVAVSTGGVASYIGYFHGFLAQPYDPGASGAVGVVEVHVDVQRWTGAGSQALSAAVRQNGVMYLAGYQLTDPSGLWTTQSFTGLTEASFKEVLGSANPDFGPGGAPFEVGYFTANSNCVGCSSYTMGVNYDNFRAELGPAPVAYCTAGTSASGCQATLSATGLPSASAASGFTVNAAGVEGAKPGLFVFGTGGRQALPWGAGSSLQCIAPPRVRGALLPGSGTKGQCDGSFAYDLNARWSAVPKQNPGAGVLVRAQLWYRDPLHPSGTTISSSNAIEFFVSP